MLKEFVKPKKFNRNELDVDYYLDILKDKNIYDKINSKFNGIDYKTIKELDISYPEEVLLKTYYFINSKNNYLRYFNECDFAIDKCLEYVQKNNYSSEKLIRKHLELYLSTRDKKYLDTVIYSFQCHIIKYSIKYTHNPEMLKDLIQEGNYILINRINKLLEVNLDYPFLYHYLIKYLDKDIFKYFQRTYYKDSYIYKDVLIDHINSYIEKNGYDKKDILQNFLISDNFLFLLLNDIEIKELSEKIFVDDKYIDLIDTYYDKNNIIDDEEKLNIIGYINYLKKILNEEEIYIFCSLIGLGISKKTNEELAKEFNISKSRINQKYHNIKRKLIKKEFDKHV